MRKIVMSLAISLDGYILDEEGNYDWIAGDGSDALNSPESERFSFEAFADSVDTLVMGRTSYDLHGQDFPQHRIWVATHRELPLDVPSNVTPLRGDIVGAVLAMRDAELGDAELRDAELGDAELGDSAQSHKDIWLFGGAKLIEPFVAQGVIDLYVIGIIPVILGAGKPLFTPGFDRIELKLKAMSTDNGIVVLQYAPRGNQ